eukprot:762480-Hanusia_phi.AAC.2
MDYRRQEEGNKEEGGREGRQVGAGLDEQRRGRRGGRNGAKKTRQSHVIDDVTAGKMNDFAAMIWLRRQCGNYHSSALL